MVRVQVGGPARTGWSIAESAVVDHLEKLIADRLDVIVFVAVPAVDPVAHSQDRKRRQSRVKIGTECAFLDPVLEDVLNGDFELALPADDPACARFLAQRGLLE